MQLGQLYPPNLVTDLLPFGTGLELSLFGHLVLLAWGGAVLARAWLRRPSPMAELATAAMLAGSGATWGHIFAGHVSFMHAWAWVPWIWALAVQAFDRRTARPALWATAALGMQMLAGHPQLTYLGLAGLAFALLARAVAAPDAQAVSVAQAVDIGLVSSPWARLPGSVAAPLLLVGLVAGALLLAAAQWAPVAALAPELNRNLATPQEIATAFSAPAQSLWSALAPQVWGGPDLTLGGISYHETLAWCGSAGLALAGLGIARAGVRGLVLAAGVVVFVLLSLGSEGPLLVPLLGTVPGLGSFRVPGRWLLPAVGLLALLAAEGTAAVAGAVDRSRRPPALAPTVSAHLQPGLAAVPLVGLVAVAAWGWATCSADGGWWAEAVAATENGAQGAASLAARAQFVAGTRSALLVTAVLGAAATGAWLRPNWHRAVTASLAFIALVQALAFGADHVGAGVGMAAARAAQASGPSRERPAAALRWSVEEVAVLQREVGARHRLATAALLRQANWGGAAGIRVAGGYEPAVPVASNRYGNLLAGRDAEGYSVNFQVRRPSPWLDRMATSHVLHDARDSQAERAFAAWPEVARFATGRVLRRHPQPFDRIAWAQRVAVQPDDAAAVKSLAAVAADTTVLAGPLPHGEGTGGALIVIEDTADTVIVRATAAGPAVLVVRDALAAGWQATVDDKPVPVTRADGLFRAVAVPAGEHVVAFRHHTPGYAVGLGVSAVAWLALASALWFSGARLAGRRQGHGQPPS